jgi:hypothetical protein
MLGLGVVVLESPMSIRRDEEAFLVEGQDAGF